MGDNLPPGVTPGDIDDHYAHPDTNTVIGEVSVGVEIETPGWMSEHDIKEEMFEQVSVSAGEILDIEIIEQK